MTVGENIKKFRKEKGFTQKKLGEKCGIAESNIRKYENNKQNPKKETIQKIADALNVHYFELDELAFKRDLESLGDIKELEEDSKNRAAIIDGIFSLLKKIYGNVQKKDVQGTYGKTFYYLVGTGDNCFVLYEENIGTLFGYLETTLPFIVDIIKEKRPEKQVIEEKLSILNDPKLKKLIEY